MMRSFIALLQIKAVLQVIKFQKEIFFAFLVTTINIQKLVPIINFFDISVFSLKKKKMDFLKKLSQIT